MISEDYVNYKFLFSLLGSVPAWHSRPHLDDSSQGHLVDIRSMLSHQAVLGKLDSRKSLEPFGLPENDSCLPFY